MNETHRQILEARARILAAPAERGITADGRIETLRFSLAGEEYAFPTESIRAVVPLKDIEPIPCTPPFVTGLMNVRGQLVAVICIGQLFGLNRERLSEVRKVIILSSGESELGITAERVAGIFSIAVAELQSFVPTFEGIRGELTRGVTADGLIVLDALKLLAHPAIVIREEAAG